MTLTKPKTQKAEILEALIYLNGINESMFKFFGYRQRLSEIRRILSNNGIRLRHVSKEFKSTYGNKGHYYQHFIINSDKAAAAKIYAKINSS